MNTNTVYHHLAQESINVDHISIISNHVFFDDLYTIYLSDDRRFFIPIRHICKTLGLDVKSQRRRIAEDRGALRRCSDFGRLKLKYVIQSVNRMFSGLDIPLSPVLVGDNQSQGGLRRSIGRKSYQYQRELSETTWAVFRSDILPAEILAEMNAQDSPEKKEFHGIMDEMNLIRKKLLSF